MCVNESRILRMKDLIKTLTEADIAYYRDDDPVMSDREYDQLTDELLKLEAETGLVISGSPTQKVSGEVLEELTSVRHTKPMLSAKKTKSIEELVRFAGGRSVLVSWKLDGLTIVLRYENGELKQAITRGREGTVGEDVTHTVRTYLNVPLTIPIRDSIEVRGEGVISWKHFNLINSDLEDTYSHPRNLAAGSTRKLDANESRKRLLEFFAFDLVSDHLERPSKLAQMQLMQNAGFSVVPFTYVDSTGGEELLRKTIDSYKPEHYGYPVDGLIVEYDDRAYGASLGATGHHENRMIALKWKDDPVPTKFLGVDLATTRTGRVSITGLFEPVAIDGAMVSRAYLHNLDIFDAFQFGVGDGIMVYKANQIIPQIAENKTKSGTFKMPMACPCCGEKLIVRTTSGGSRQMYCENPYCAAKLIRKFTHFCEKTRMNIEGLSQTTLSKFLGHGWIRNLGDLYELEKYRDEFLQTPGFGEKSFERLLASIEKSRHCTLAKFIAGLGIPMVGRHAGRDLDRYFGGSWEAFEQAVKDGFDFTQLHDFGKTMNNNIYIWYGVAFLTPFRRRTETSVDAMNARLQALVNPPAPGRAEAVSGQLCFRLGDKVMQIKNYEQVNNGDVGYITSITGPENEAVVEIDFGDGRIMKYESDQLRMLDLGYASTVHKSQGAQYKSVILNLQCAHAIMLMRAIVYTAITRARLRLTIVGERKALCRAIRNTKADQRGTRLAQRIQDFIE